MIYTFFVCLFAGLGAGIGTGFAGLSAAAVISPMLITFLGLPAYQSVGIALASDVLASAASAYTYKKNGNLDVKNGLIMMVSVLCFTMVGSFLASLLPDTTMGSFSVVMTFFLGLKFVVKPINHTKQDFVQSKTPAQRILESVLCGIVIGLICGFVGAGGGMMMLMILTMVLGYELKTAVGTSVFIMSFTAFTGAVSHFVIGESFNIPVLVLCIEFTLLGAQVSARFANRVSNKTMNIATGIVLMILGAVMIVMKIFF